MRTGRNFGHTAADTIDEVSAHDLRVDSTFVARLMARVACWEPWPAKQKTTEEILEVIGELGMLEAMKFQGKKRRSRGGTGAKSAGAGAEKRYHTQLRPLQ